MKKSTKLILSIGLLAAAGLIVYSVRRHQSNRRYTRISDEGYETAADILYPDKSHGRRKLRYGPVLPE